MVSRNVLLLTQHLSTQAPIFLWIWVYYWLLFLVLPLTLKVLDVVLHSSIKKAKGLFDLKINSAGTRLHIYFAFQFLVCFIYACK